MIKSIQELVLQIKVNLSLNNTFSQKFTNCKYQMTFRDSKIS